MRVLYETFGLGTTRPNEGDHAVSVKLVLAFQKHGMPEAVLCDKGSLQGQASRVFRGW